MNTLQDKVAIITGAGEGIGRGIARRFAAEGAGVVVAEFNDETGKRTVAELEKDFGAKALFVHTDVREKDHVLAMVDQAIKHFGRVDILVNNAWGRSGRGMARVENTTDSEMEHAIKLGFMGVFWAMQAVFPHMKANGCGRIITVCSLNGVNAHMYTVDYNSVKEAARTLTRTAAREWAPLGITANIICPAAVSASFLTFQSMAPELSDELTKANPMGRMGDPEEDIAPLALFLASEESRYVTGNTIHVDGGSHINGVAWTMELPE